MNHIQLEVNRMSVPGKKVLEVIALMLRRDCLQNRERTLNVRRGTFSKDIARTFETRLLELSDAEQAAITAFCNTDREGWSAWADCHTCTYRNDLPMLTRVGRPVLMGLPYHASNDPEAWWNKIQVEY
jgi:hypothetical protein